MKRITLLCMLFISSYSWQGHAQFTESFDTEIPATWTVVDQDGQGNTWEYSTEYPYQGAGHVRLQWETNAHEDYLISPQFTVTTGVSDRVSFYAGGDGTFYVETFDVKLSTTGTAPADFTVTLGSETATGDASNDDYLQYIYDLSAYDGQAVYIAIVGTATDQFYLAVDEFMVDTVPSCLQPTDLTATSIMATTADLGWIPGGTETSWNVEIVPVGTSPTGTPTFSGVTNPYTATLDPATDYEFYVQADCTGGDLSYWSGPYSFTTLCVAYTPDYTQNFDTFVPNCWEVADSGDPTTGPSDFGISSWSSDEFLNTGTNMAVNVNLYFNNKTEWLISPSIDLSGGATELTYMVAATDYANSDPIEGGMMGTDDEVQVLISEDDGVTWTNLMTYNATNTPSNTGDLATIDLSAYTGTVKIAFWASEGAVNDDSTYDYDFFIDDFAVSAAGGGGTGGNCSQTQVSNNFENGFGMNESGGFLVADDFIVSSSTTNFSVESITGNFMVTGGIASMDVLFYTDNAGLPGTQIGTTIEDIVPTSQTIIGTAFGFDVYEVVLDLPTPIDFAGSGTADDATYWMQLVAVPTVPATTVYWEVTTIGVIGNSVAVTAADLIAWTHDATNPDAVFTISGVCTYVACPGPTDLMANNVLQTSADITWTAGGSETEWEIEYGLAGFSLGSGTIVADTGGIIGETLSSLTPGSGYDVYVTAICGVGDESFAAGPLSFMTPCAAITSFPFEESFEDTSLTRDCWTNEYVSGNFDWNYVSTNGDGSVAPRTGTLMAEFRVGSYNGEATKLVSPPLDLSSLVNPQLRFYYANVDWAGDIDELRVYYKTSATGTWTQIGDDYMTAHTSWTEVILPLPNPSSEYYIAFEGTSGFGFGMNLDDVTVQETPSCPEPSDIVIGTITHDTAVITWTENGTAVEWEIEYGLTGFVPGTGTVVADNDGTLGETLTALTAETDYDVYVTAICGAGDESAQVGPESFTTTDMGVEDQVFEGFSYYPNPVSSSLSLKATSEIQQVVVYDLLGQEVLKTQPNSLTPTLELSNLQTGAYLMKVTINGTEGTYQFIKE